ncbi:MAG: GerAB/ArcD/ProY family transporter [Bacillota bacterium]
MLREGKFGLAEAVSITSLLMITKIFYTSPMIVVKKTGTAAWYMTLISFITASALFYLVYLLMKRFPGKNIIQVFEAVLGEVIGKAMGILFSGFILYYSAMNLREFLELLKAYVLPYTPPSLIFIGFIAVTVLLAYMGLEVIARVSYMSIFPVFIGMAVLLVMASTFYNPESIKPFFGFGLGNTLINGIYRSSAYAEVILLALAINALNDISVFKRAGFISLAIGGAVFSICLLLYIMAFGYTVGSENLSGMFQLSRIIYISRFVQRVEAIFLFIWILCSVVTVSTSFYMSIATYCKALNIPDHKPLVYMFAILLFAIAILPQNISEVIEIHMLVIRQYSGIWIFGGPILVLVISLLLGKKGGKAESEKG